MQSITAIAHLRSAVLYILDISEQCGWTIAQQIQLFESIQPLFANKPLFVVINKIDIRRFEDLTPEERALINKVEQSGATIMTMSTATGEGVAELKTLACEKLLEKRVEQKLQGSKIDSVVNRIHVAEPIKRDGKIREANIPESVTNKMTDHGPTRKLEKDLMKENGGAGVYSVDVTKHYLFDNDEWKTDRIPEIMDGVNIADFVDPDILARLDELEREEEANANNMEEEEVVDDLTEEQQAALAAIRKKKEKLITNNRMKISNPIPRSRATPQSADKFEDHLQEMGIKLSDDARGRLRERSRSRSMSVPATNKRSRSQRSKGDEEEEGGRKRTRSESRARSLSVHSVKEGEGYRNVKQKVDAVRRQRSQHKKLAMHGKVGESDRKIQTKMPRHLFAGKRGMGKTDRR
jgi:nucleolar GTP-binding protein